MQLLVLGGVVACVLIVVLQSAQRDASGARADVQSRSSEQGIRQQRLDDNLLAGARASIEEMDEALQEDARVAAREMERKRLEAAAVEQKRQEKARREAEIERGQKLREQARSARSAKLEAAMAKVETETAGLVLEAHRRENRAIQASHATVAQRNYDQWFDLSHFLAGNILHT